MSAAITASAVSRPMGQSTPECGARWEGSVERLPAQYRAVVRRVCEGVGIKREFRHEYAIKVNMSAWCAGRFRFGGGCGGDLAGTKIENAESTATLKCKINLFQPGFCEQCGCFRKRQKTQMCARCARVSRGDASLSELAVNFAEQPQKFFGRIRVPIRAFARGPWSPAEFAVVTFQTTVGAWRGCDGLCTQRCAGGLTGKGDDRKSGSTRGYGVHRIYVHCQGLGGRSFG